MVYVCELKPGHHVYLDNQGNQTIVTVKLEMPGQQQQTSSSITTGTWIAPPEAYQSDDGVVFKLLTPQGEVGIYIQDNSVSMIGNVSSVAGAQRLSVQQTTTTPTTMQPMQPMQPMGNMSMTMNPMEMRMGNMELKMDAVNQPVKTTRQFCSQCGAKVAPEDRFCSSCGHRLI